MKQEQPMTELESFAIIRNMINAAKTEQKDNGRSWIIWGWLLLSVSLLTVMNLHFAWVEQIYFFWNLFGLFSIALFTFEGIKKLAKKNQDVVRTYYKDLFKLLKVGFFISLAFIILNMNTGLSPYKGFGLLISLYAFWILIYGAVSNFKPSIVAAFICWILAILCLFVKKIEYLMYVHAAAALIGYIIPGYLANKAFKKNI
ncbi:hypothetical protein [Polluticaenibacter yanchengensis]|uniref:Uncharacterized protein n=1 Tax=Polluticaenibacter yanchengensis TaxID=3014562 RepID=A0ABT4UIJ0_9BACT|nr:hypothetical protein [Chitinophagaceae bacterium LY-5]